MTLDDLLKLLLQRILQCILLLLQRILQYILLLLQRILQRVLQCILLLLQRTLQCIFQVINFILVKIFCFSPYFFEDLAQKCADLLKPRPTPPYPPYNPAEPAGGIGVLGGLEYFWKDHDGSWKLKDHWIRTGINTFKLKEGYERFHNGFIQIKEGYERLPNGDCQVKEGYERLRNGNCKVKEGYYRLRNGDCKLKPGYEKRPDGSCRPKRKFALTLQQQQDLRDVSGCPWWLTTRYNRDDDGNLYSYKIPLPPGSNLSPERTLAILSADDDDDLLKALICGQGPIEDFDPEYTFISSAEPKATESLPSVHTSVKSGPTLKISPPGPTPRISPPGPTPKTSAPRPGVFDALHKALLSPEIRGPLRTRESAHPDHTSSAPDRKGKERVVDDATSHHPDPTSSEPDRKGKGRVVDNSTSHHPDPSSSSAPDRKGKGRVVDDFTSHHPDPTSSAPNKKGKERAVDNFTSHHPDHTSSEPDRKGKGRAVDNTDEVDSTQDTAEQLAKSLRARNTSGRGSTKPRTEQSVDVTDEEDNTPEPVEVFWPRPERWRNICRHPNRRESSTEPPAERIIEVTDKTDSPHDPAEESSKSSPAAVKQNGSAENLTTRASTQITPAPVTEPTKPVINSADKTESTAGRVEKPVRNPPVAAEHVHLPQRSTTDRGTQTDAVSPTELKERVKKRSVGVKRVHSSENQTTQQASETISAGITQPQQQVVDTTGQTGKTPGRPKKQLFSKANFLARHRQNDSEPFTRPKKRAVEAVYQTGSSDDSPKESEETPKTPEALNKKRARFTGDSFAYLQLQATIAAFEEPPKPAAFEEPPKPAAFEEPSKPAAFEEPSKPVAFEEPPKPAAFTELQERATEVNDVTSECSDDVAAFEEPSKPAAFEEPPKPTAFTELQERATKVNDTTSECLDDDDDILRGVSQEDYSMASATTKTEAEDLLLITTGIKHLFNLRNPFLEMDPNAQKKPKMPARSGLPWHLSNESPGLTAQYGVSTRQRYGSLKYHKVKKTSHQAPAVLRSTNQIYTVSNFLNLKPRNIYGRVPVLVPATNKEFQDAEAMETAPTAPTAEAVGTTATASTAEAMETTVTATTVETMEPPATAPTAEAMETETTAVAPTAEATETTATAPTAEATGTTTTTTSEAMDTTPIAPTAEATGTTTTTTAEAMDTTPNAPTAGAIGTTPTSPLPAESGNAAPFARAPSLDRRAPPTTPARQTANREQQQGSGTSNRTRIIFEYTASPGESILSDRKLEEEVNLLRNKVREEEEQRQAAAWRSLNEAAAAQREREKERLRLSQTPEQIAAEDRAKAAVEERAWIDAKAHESSRDKGLLADGDGEGHWAGIIDAAMQSLQGKHPPGGPIKFGKDLSLADAKTLLLNLGAPAGVSGWLNDNIINDYLRVVTDQIKAEAGWKKANRTRAPPPVVAFSSHLLTTMQAEGGKQRVKSWARPFNLEFEKLYEAPLILIPCNNGTHWTLLAISGTKKTITHYDSLGGAGQPWLKLAREWLANHLGESYEARRWKEVQGVSHQQSNSMDCGVYTALNGHALAAARKPSEAFTPEDVLSGGREHIAAALLGKQLITRPV